MSKEARYRDCGVPAAFTVLGLLLKPFSLGHHLLLQNVSSPFLYAPATTPVNLQQLLISVYLCSVTYEQGVTVLRNGDLTHEIEEWLLVLQRVQFDHAQAAAVFRDYLTDGYALPALWKYESDLRLSAPWEEVLRIRLLQTGLTLTEILNLYLPQAWFTYYAHWELKQLERPIAPSDFRPAFYTEADRALEAQLNAPPHAS